MTAEQDRSSAHDRKIVKTLITYHDEPNPTYGDIANVIDFVRSIEIQGILIVITQSHFLTNKDTLKLQNIYISEAS